MRPPVKKFSGQSGVQIAYDVVGPEQAVTVLLAHGGGQTRHAWRKCGEVLASSGYRAVALDLRGHGDSDWAPDKDYRLETFAADLARASDRFSNQAGPPHLVGASLGGLSGMIAAGELKSAGFASLTLVDVTPRMDRSGVSRVVNFMGAHLETGFSTLEEAAEVVARYLPHRPRPNELGGLRKNLRRRKDGRWYWHWDPAFINGSKRPSAALKTRDLERALTGIRIPIHLIRGGMSELVSLASVQAFKELVPEAAFTDVADARHMVAGDQNDAFIQAVVRFISALEHDPNRYES